jgi:hypothetical protein
MSFARFYRRKAEQFEQKATKKAKGSEDGHAGELTRKVSPVWQTSSIPSPDDDEHDREIPASSPIVLVLRRRPRLLRHQQEHWFLYFGANATKSWPSSEH